MAISIPQHSLHQWVVSAQFDPALFAIYTVGCFSSPSLTCSTRPPRRC